jgi:hypothetical protein
MVPIKDMALVGKKIDCPKCKYRFVVEEPEAAEDAEAEVVAPGGKKTAKKGKGADKAGGKKPKKKADAGSNKMVLGLSLAGVGVAVLCVAGYFLVIKGDNKKNTPSNPPQADKTQNASQPANEGDKGEQPKKAPVTAVAVKGPQGNPEITNLLPNKTDSVIHLRFKEILETPAADALMARMPDRYFQQRLGFSLKTVDEVIRAESYREDWAFNVVHASEPIDFDAVTKALRLVPVKEAIKNHTYFLTPGDNPWLDQLGRLSLSKRSRSGTDKSRKGPVAVHKYDDQTLVFADEVAMKQFLDQDRAPKPLTPKPTAPAKAEKPPEQPEQPLMLGKGRGAGPGVGGDQRGGPAERGGPPSGPPKGENEPEPPSLSPLEESYLTIDPRLRAMLIALGQTEDKVLVQAATLRQESADHLKQVWDITNWMAKEPANAEVVGAGLQTKEEGKYTYLCALACKNQSSAEKLRTELLDTTGPDFAQFFTDATGIEIKVQKDEEEKPESPQGGENDRRDPRMGRGGPTAGIGGRGGPAAGVGGRGGAGVPPPPLIGGKGMVGGDRRGGTPDAEGKNPDNPDEKTDTSPTGIRVTQDKKVVKFQVNLVLEEKDRQKLGTVAALVLAGLRGELDEMGGESQIHRLGAAVRQLPGQDKRFPPAALYRKPAPERSNYPWEPDKRISFLAKLLPFMGHEAVERRINWDASWNDKENWLAARTLIPELQVPSYPVGSRYTRYPGLPMDVATTHFVGLSGIGEDSAAESDRDPEAAKRLGILGYDRSTPVSALERGAANTAFMIQVPPQHVAPWLAGGGSTVRGVPETNPLEPFLSFKLPSGERATHVLMADGSVRLVTEKMSPQVFKAVVAIKGKVDVKEEDWKPVEAPRGVGAKAPEKPGEAPPMKEPPPKP